MVRGQVSNRDLGPGLAQLIPPSARESIFPGHLYLLNPCRLRTDQSSLSTLAEISINPEPFRP